jgi:phosphatidylserine/phosphatidylglycerophosphate/cardiolipin synthase-like enzyme
MSAHTLRTIYSRASARQVPDLLQTVFVAELLRPSRCLWLVSPWVSDIPVLDNRANGFLALEPLWVRAPIRLSRVLVQLLRQGTTVHVATRPADHNRGFLQRLEEQARAGDLPLFLHQAENLHAKGILGDGFLLAGSMNFTYSGISLNEEAVTFTTDPNEVARTRVELTQRWGGARQ